jgi:hypothetical protein
LDQLEKQVQARKKDAKENEKLVKEYMDNVNSNKRKLDELFIFNDNLINQINKT